MQLKPLAYTTWGTDPEAFFSKDGQIIGSERLIPEAGLLVGTDNKIVRDGVQFELNPATAMYIPMLARNISSMFQMLKQTLKYKSDIDICFDGLVEVSREELDSLSPATRRLGCMPSENFYGPHPINVDPIEYRKRSSGGHIHMGLGLPIYSQYGINGPDHRSRLVPLLDLFVGNTAVLLDRDPGAAERRENYGRAGEYRLPKYGLEYRTLSNFWLRDYSLMSLMFSMASIAISVLAETLHGNDLEGKLVDTVDINKIIEAINTNNFDLALENFRTLQPFLKATLPDNGFQLNPGNLNQFISFVECVNRNGIECYFPTEDIVNNWCGNKQEEFSTFISRT